VKSSEFRRTLNLSDARRRKTLDAAGAVPSAVGAAHEHQTDGPPASPRDFEIGLAITQPDRPIAYFAVSARSMSQHTMCILHSGFLHTGTRCEVFAINSPESSRLSSGEVRWVHHIDGGVHAVGIRVDATFDTRPLVGRDAGRRGAGVQAPPAAISDIRGRVLIFDARRSDAEAARTHLRAVGLDVTIATDTNTALGALGGGSPDVMVCDLDLDAGMTAEVAMRMFARRGFAGPIVIATGSEDRARLDTLREAGVADIVRKPCERKELLVAVTSALVRAGAIRAKPPAPALPPLRSTLSWSADSDHLVKMYIEEARTMAASLASAMEGNDRNTIRRTCIALRGSAANYGFEPLAEASSRAADAVAGNADRDAVAAIIAEIGVLAARLAPSHRAA